ncbi:hypothetical protein OSB04_013975 [Centaurea solstitialis]|uniref:Desiccation-related protein PCC13-62 n=1 Tax=Centaurea solstitialis TaxID=347529 RepID=A0AA38TPV8_9ASTR|nr:hypothetical protein OSB04_013975 [Centaurea solstitialis]
MAAVVAVVFFLLLVLLLPETPNAKSKFVVDENILEFHLNLEYLEAEFFLYGSLGKGLDKLQPNLTGGGPPPVGARMAHLTPLIRNIFAQFGAQEIGHIREIKSKIGELKRPLMNLSAQSFATVINQAFGRPLYPLFDPYLNDINYLLASYIIPYVGLTGYVGSTPKLKTSISRKLVAGLLAVESGQDAVVRSLLYERAMVRVMPYGITVAEFTDRISALRNKLGRNGIKDEGLVITSNNLKIKGKWKGNILVGNRNSLAYGRTPKESLRIVYGSGKEQVPGGFYPRGAEGTIARKYLINKD